MGRKIYNRFETLKEAAGSPGNMVYKTQDLADGSIVQLLEWTPDPAAFAASRDQLGAAQDDVPEVEVFSSPPSLYIASSSADAALDALRKLQTKGLFPGDWPGADSPMSPEQWENYWKLQDEIRQVVEKGAGSPDGLLSPRLQDAKILTPERAIALETEPIQPPVVVPPPPPAPAPPPPRPGPAPRPRQKARSTGWLTAVMVLVAVGLAVAIGLVWRDRNRRIAEEERQRQQAVLQQIEQQRQDEQRKLQLAQAETERKQREIEQQMRQAEAQHEIDLANERQRKEEAEQRLLQQQEEARRREEERIAAAKAEEERQAREARRREEQEQARRKIEIANARAAQKRKDDQEQERLMRANAKAVTDSFAQRQMNLSTTLRGQYHRIRIVNKCDAVTIDVAIRFQGLDGVWVTQGWWNVGPHQEKAAPLVYSQNPTFYFYAEGGNRIWEGQDANPETMEIVENPFTHLMEPIVGKNRRVVKAIRRDYTTGYGEHLVPFSCQ